MMDFSFICRAGQILADRGPTVRVGTIDIISLDGLHILWPDSAADAGDPTIQLIEGSLDAAIERAELL